MPDLLIMYYALNFSDAEEWHFSFIVYVIQIVTIVMNA